MVLQHLKPKLELLTFMDVKKGDKKGPNFQTWVLSYRSDCNIACIMNSY